MAGARQMPSKLSMDRLGRKIKGFYPGCVIFLFFPISHFYSFKVVVLFFPFVMIFQSYSVSFFISFQHFHLKKFLLAGYL